LLINAAHVSALTVSNLQGTGKVYFIKSSFCLNVCGTNSTHDDDDNNNNNNNWGEVLKKKWKNKAMHGQYIRNIDRQLVSEEDTFLWLTKGDLKAETESENEVLCNKNTENRDK
jgi:hypothetical protein